MDTNSISSNKITLKLSTPQGREMALNKGDVLQAQVQEVGEDGAVTILVKGRPIEAFSEVSVKPGQQLLLMVDELKQGKTYLKVVTPELMGKIETANISANLAGMGIAAREDTIMLARKLLQHNLPVTQNNLNELSRNVSTLGGMNAKNLEIGAFALSRGISGKESLASLSQFLSSTGESARLVLALEHLANAMTAANTDIETGSQAAAAKDSASSSSSAAASTGIAVVITDSESEKQSAPAAGSPKQAAVPKEGESPAAGVRNTSPAGIQGRMVMIKAAGESLSGSGSSEASIDSARTSVFGGEKPAAAKQGEPVLPSKPDSGGITTKDNSPLPSAGAGERPAQAAAAGARNMQPAASGQAGAPAASSENTVQIPQNIATPAGASAQEPAVSITQIITAKVNAEEPVPASAFLADLETTTGLLSEEDRIGVKSLAQGTAAESEPLKQNIIKLLDAVRSLMEVDLQDVPEQIAGKLRSSDYADKEIVKALSLLADMAKNSEITDKIPQLKEFSLSLDRLEKEMSGQQLFNLSSRSAADSLSGFYYFAFPVKIDQEYSLCQLKINKDGRRNLKDADELSFVVSLNTAKLGLVLFHIKWQRIGSLQLQGLAEDQASSNFLNRNIGKLISKLEDLGYSVKNLGVKVSSSAEDLRVRPVLQEVTERVRPLGIDVTI